MVDQKVFLSFAFLLSICIYPAPIEAKETKSETQTKTSQESDQQIKDFSLSGYGEKGKKSWDLAGQSADIFNEVVKLKQVIGNNYAQNDTINLTADKGDFNKTSGVVHLEDNVVVTSASGTTLTTDTLDWDRKQQIVKTMDKVNLSRQDMNLTGQGAQGQTALKQITLEKDVRLDIDTLDKQINQKERIMITCDGPLEVNYEKNIAIFNNNVKVETSDLTMDSDRMQVYFTPKQEEAKKIQGAGVMSSSINKIIAQGNVRILRGGNTSFSQEAIYTAADKKIILTGRPQIEVYQTENIDATFRN
jgi:LPS export ABC transporter protein LptC